MEGIMKKPMGIIKSCYDCPVRDIVPDADYPSGLRHFEKIICLKKDRCVKNKIPAGTRPTIILPDWCPLEDV
jgi:hypothetical protein